MATLVKYWPAVVAGLYLAYVVAAGSSAQIGPAVIALFDRARSQLADGVRARENRGAAVKTFEFIALAVVGWLLAATLPRNE